MEFPITYIVLLVWILLILGLNDNYMRLLLSFFGLLIGLNLTYNDLWLVFTYNYSQSFTYSTGVLTTIATTYTASNSLIVISNVYDQYLGLIVVALSLMMGFRLTFGIIQGRKEQREYEN